MVLLYSTYFAQSRHQVQLEYLEVKEGLRVLEEEAHDVKTEEERLLNKEKKVTAKNTFKTSAMFMFKFWLTLFFLLALYFSISSLCFQSKQEDDGGWSDGGEAKLTMKVSDRQVDAFERLADEAGDPSACVPCTLVLLSPCPPIIVASISPLLSLFLPLDFLPLPLPPS
eukprot:755754-Hanusia_phi.AAC.1